MDYQNTASLAEEALDDLYLSVSSLPTNKETRRNVKKSTKTLRLEPIHSNSSQSLMRPKKETESHHPILLPKQSLTPLRSVASEEAFSKLQHGNVSDLHYLSNMKKKAAGISGMSPIKGTFTSPNRKKDNLTDLSDEVGFQNEELPNNSEEPVVSKKQIQNHNLKNDKLGVKVEEMQYQLLQESNYLSNLMSTVVAQYEKLKAINESVLIHRREIGNKVHEINETYIKLFEEMLTEVMKIQRMKFKVRKEFIHFLFFFYILPFILKLVANQTR
jgi:hypothetical protein